jgi:hypothetical protein
VNNTTHGLLAAPYDILVSDGRMHDIDSSDWDRWYILLYFSGCTKQVSGVNTFCTEDSTELVTLGFLAGK